MKTPLFIVALTSAAQAAPFLLPPETAGFKSGPGVEIAQGQCLICHSADYISIQPTLPRAFWKAAVEKMQAKYGAPIPADQIPPLVDYLAKTYGAEKPK